MNKSVLIIGAGTEKIAEIFLQQNTAEVYIITNDEESLIQTRITLTPALSHGERENIFIRLMDYDNTDFKSEKFDIVYLQGSTGTKQRTKIIKEIKRILKPDGYLCVGEIVSKTEEIPAFIINIWKDSGIFPLSEKEFPKFFIEKNFKLIHWEDLSYTLKDFYTVLSNLADKEVKNLPGKEITLNKRLIKRIKHEADVYLSLGGNKYIGYSILVLKNIRA